MNGSTHIIIVDDDSGDRILIKTAFEDIELAAEITELEDGAAILEFIKNNCKTVNPDLIILDINMPKYTGVEVMEFLHDNPGLCNAPIFIFSTSAHPEEMSKVLSFGAVKYVVKPTNYEGYVSFAREIDDFLRSGKNA